MLTHQWLPAAAARPFDQTVFHAGHDGLQPGGRAKLVQQPADVVSGCETAHPQRIGYGVRVHALAQELKHLGLAPGKMRTRQARVRRLPWVWSSLYPFTGDTGVGAEGRLHELSQQMDDPEVSRPARHQG